MAASMKNLWAPWRMEYIRSLEQDQAGGCFMCRYWASPQEDRQNLLVWRGPAAMAILNRFPYSNGHVLVAPARHVGDLDQLSPAEMLELLAMTRDMQVLLKSAIQAQGFNVGMNFGRCAGAGLPDHLHIHVVPRWEGDTNFMPVLGQVRVIPQALETIYDLIQQRSAQMSLPRLDSPPPS
jgi:ATP adenylyltransferase